MRKIIMLITLFSLVALFGACGNNDDKVVIYSSMEDYRNEDLKEQLKAKFPDLDFSIEHHPTGNHAAKLQSEGINTKADIVLGLETAYVEKLKNNFEVLSDYDFAKFSEELVSKDKKYIPWDRYSGAIIVNTKVLADNGLAEPTGYNDLLNSIYKDLIMMPNPKTSGTGYQFLVTLINIMGEDQAFTYMDEFAKNVLNFSTSGSGPVNSLVRGEIAIGLGMTFHAVKEINEGAPLKIIYDTNGAPYNTSSGAVIKGRLEKPNVKKVFDYLFDEFLLRDKELFIPEMVLKNQPDITIPNFPEITYANMNGINDIDLKTRLLDKWNY